MVSESSRLTETGKTGISSRNLPSDIISGVAATLGSFTIVDLEEIASSESIVDRLIDLFDRNYSD